MVWRTSLKELQDIPGPGMSSDGQKEVGNQEFFLFGVLGSTRLRVWTVSTGDRPMFAQRGGGKGGGVASGLRRRKRQRFRHLLVPAATDGTVMWQIYGP